MRIVTAMMISVMACTLAGLPRAEATTCTFDVKAINTSKTMVIVGFTRSQVKIKGKNWKVMRCKVAQLRLAAGAAATIGCTMIAGTCSKERRYKFAIKKEGSPMTWKRHGWTKSSTIDLGDVSK